MALPTFEEQNALLIQQFANGLYNVQVGSETMDAVMADIATAGSTDAVFNSYYTFSYGSASVVDVAAMVTENVNIIEGENGVTAEMVTLAQAYIVSVLNANPGNEGAALSSLLTSYAAVSTGPYAAAAASWNAEIDVALAWEGAEDVPVDTNNPVPPVETMFMLTANQDILDGSAEDDMFVADVVQVNGPQVNSLGTGDSIDGADGFDTLAAQVTKGFWMGGGNMPIQPRTESVENVELEALFSNIDTDSGDNGYYPRDYDYKDSSLDPSTVFVNAKNMVGLDMISSVNSDASLVIQDLKTDVNEENPSGFDHTVTQTIGMKYSGNADSHWDESDLHVYFDQDHLSAGIEAQPSQAYFWLLDEDGHDATIADAPPGYDAGDEEYGGYEPLQTIDREGVQFSLTDVDGVNTPDLAVIIGSTTDNSYTDAKTWHEYVDLLNAELPGLADVDPIYSTLSFSIDPELIDTTNSDLNLDVEIPAIVLTDSANGTFPKEDLGFVRDSGATGEFDVYGRVDNEIVGPEDLLITVNVELEKVGRGGDGGELVIGGMNKGGDNECGDGSDTTPAGVEQFNVVVNGDHFLPNSLSSLRSTNNALQVVNVTSQDGFVSERNEETGLREGAASLEIGNSNTESYGAIAHGNIEYIEYYDHALKDVRVFDASTFQGDLTLNAGLTDEIVCKYDLVDTSDNEDLEPVSFEYTGGVGDDTIRLQIYDSEDDGDSFVTNIDGGDGNDVILTRGGDSMITGGLGDDVIHLSGNYYSNETLVYEGFGNGTDTVYNFDQSYFPGGEVPVPAQPEIFILDFADFTGDTTSFTLEAPAGTILGTVNLDGLEDAQGVIPAQDVAFAVAQTAVLGYDVVGYTPGDTTVTFEAVVNGNQEDVVVSIADPLADAATTLTVIDGVEAFSPATAETFDVDFAPATGDELIVVADGTLLMDGASIDYAIGDGPLTLAAKLAAATFDNYSAVDNGDGSVTFTANEAGAVTPGAPTAFLEQIDTDNPDLLADFGSGLPQTPATIDQYFGVQASWMDGTDGSGEIIELPPGPGAGLDMIDFTDYDVDAVEVNGVVVEVRELEEDEDEVIIDRVVELTSVVVDEVVQEGQYSMSVTAGDAGVEVGLIGVIDFGEDQGEFTPDTFII